MRRSARVSDPVLRPCTAPADNTLHNTGSLSFTDNVQVPSLNSQKSLRRQRTGPAPRRKRASSLPMALPVCVVGLMAPAAVPIVVVEAVVDEAPIVVVVAFEVAVAGLRLDLARLLDQSRRTSPPRGTHLPLERSLARPNMTRRPCRRLKVPHRSSSLSLKLASQLQRRRGPVCLLRPNPHLQYPRQLRNLPPLLLLLKRPHKHPKERLRMKFHRIQLCRPKNNLHPQLQTRSPRRRHHPPPKKLPRRRQTR